MIPNDVRKALYDLIKSNDSITVTSAEKFLSESLGVKVEFCPRQKRGKQKAIHGRTKVVNLSLKDIYVELEGQIDLDVQELKLLQYEPEIRQLISLKEQIEEERAASIDPLLERAITAIANLEKRRDFVWAGFVVKDMLPGMGLDMREAQAWFDRMVDQEILVREKRANPNNPDYPSTCVKLNREHDIVKIALNLNGTRVKPFMPIPIRGEPASATLIRER